MSGIAGIIHFDGKPVEPGLIERMTGAMAYRGPDGINHWVKGSVALGQCMLRTTPESLEEHQPLTNEDESLVLVMDGRVDNWEELRRELLARGAVLRNRSDAELVLRAYEFWGRECLAHIDGDFALVFWDARRQEAFCARDRMGNKPFNYHWYGKTLVISSALHAILDLPWVKEEPNEGMLAEFLAAEWYSRDETLWRGISRLVAAHRMVVGPAGPQFQQYWEPDLWETLRYKKDEEYIEHYRELVLDNVRRLSRSHRPVVIEVSGGLDSSAVLCVAEHLRKSNKLPAPRIEAYTLAFANGSEADELVYARAVGEHLGVRIHEILPSVLPIAWYKTRALFDRDFPGFPNASTSIGMREIACSEGSRVTLTGEGGDAWLQGSRAYYAEALAQGDWARLWDCFRTDSAVFGSRQALQWLIRHGFFPLLPAHCEEVVRRLVRRMRGSGSRDPYWLSPRMLEAIGLRRGVSSPRHTQRVRRIGQQQLLDNLYDAFTARVLEEIDRLGVEFGVETRHPLNTPRLVQYAFSTPESLRLRGDRTKYIHVRALQEFLPQIILDRKGKAEFSVVFRGPLDRMGEELTETLPQERADWVAADGIARLFRTYQDSPQIGWPMWVLWGTYGCNCVFAQT